MAAAPVPAESDASVAAIAELSAALADVADAVRPRHLGERTPCSRFSVAGLLGHLAYSLESCERAAHKAAAQDTAHGTAPVAAKDVAAASRRTGAAWQRPEALLGTTEFGLVPGRGRGPERLPAAFAVMVTVQELGLHGWDLARSIGLSFRVSPETGQVLVEAVGAFAARARSSGGYGPALDLSPNAPALLRALAASGRSPSWSSRPRLRPVD